MRHVYSSIRRIGLLWEVNEAFQFHLRSPCSPFVGRAHAPARLRSLLAHPLPEPAPMVQPALFESEGKTLPLVR